MAVKSILLKSGLTVIPIAFSPPNYQNNTFRINPNLPTPLSLNCDLINIHEQNLHIIIIFVFFVCFLNKARTFLFEVIYDLLWFIFVLALRSVIDYTYAVPYAGAAEGVAGGHAHLPPPPPPLCRLGGYHVPPLLTAYGQWNPNHANRGVCCKHFDVKLVHQMVSLKTSFSKILQRLRRAHPPETPASRSCNEQHLHADLTIGIGLVNENPNWGVCCNNFCVKNMLKWCTKWRHKRLHFQKFLNFCGTSPLRPHPLRRASATSGANTLPIWNLTIAPPPFKKSFRRR